MDVSVRIGTRTDTDLAPTWFFSFQQGNQAGLPRCGRMRFIQPPERKGVHSEFPGLCLAHLVARKVRFAGKEFKSRSIPKQRVGPTQTSWLSVEVRVRWVGFNSPNR